MRRTRRSPAGRSRPHRNAGCRTGRQRHIKCGLARSAAPTLGDVTTIGPGSIGREDESDALFDDAELDVGLAAERQPPSPPRPPAPPTTGGSGGNEYEPDDLVVV